MLSRGTVYTIIDSERQYQDANYKPSERTSSGLTREERDREAIVGIAMLEDYIQQARSAWTKTKGSQLPALQMVGKIAAIAVRTLERAGGSEDLVNGLR